MWQYVHKVSIPRLTTGLSDRYGVCLSIHRSVPVFSFLPRPSNDRLVPESGPIWIINSVIKPLPNYCVHQYGYQWLWNIVYRYKRRHSELGKQNYSNQRWTIYDITMLVFINLSHVLRLWTGENYLTRLTGYGNVCFRLSDMAWLFSLEAGKRQVVR